MKRFYFTIFEEGEYWYWDARNFYARRCEFFYYCALFSICWTVPFFQNCAQFLVSGMSKFSIAGNGLTPFIGRILPNFYIWKNHVEIQEIKKLVISHMKINSFSCNTPKKIKKLFVLMIAVLLHFFPVGILETFWTLKNISQP